MARTDRCAICNRLGTRDRWPRANDPGRPASDESVGRPVCAACSSTIDRHAHETAEQRRRAMREAERQWRCLLVLNQGFEPLEKVGGTA